MVFQKSLSEKYLKSIDSESQNQSQWHSEEQFVGSQLNGCNGDYGSSSRFDGWLVLSTQYPSHDSSYALVTGSTQVHYKFIVFQYLQKFKDCFQ